MAPNVITEKQRRWALLVTDLTASFDEVIRLAAKHPRDGVLSSLRQRAEKGRAALAAHVATFSSEPHGFGSLGEWGPNGHAPKVRTLLVEARLRDERLSAAPMRRAA